MEKKQKKEEKKETTKVVETGIPLRGRFFEGPITKKFDRRVVVEFERTVFVKKYERFYKKTIRIHARIPEGMDLAVGDYVKVRECRPLSKIIHHVVIEKIRSSNNKQHIKDKEAKVK